MKMSNKKKAFYRCANNLKSHEGLVHQLDK